MAIASFRKPSCWTPHLSLNRSLEGFGQVAFVMEHKSVPLLRAPLRVVNIHDTAKIPPPSPRHHQPPTTSPHCQLLTWSTAALPAGARLEALRTSHRSSAQPSEACCVSISTPPPLSSFPSTHSHLPRPVPIRAAQKQVGCSHRTVGPPHVIRTQERGRTAALRNGHLAEHKSFST